MFDARKRIFFVSPNYPNSSSSSNYGISHKGKVYDKGNILKPNPEWASLETKRTSKLLPDFLDLALSEAKTGGLGTHLRAHIQTTTKPSDVEVTLTLMETQMEELIAFCGDDSNGLALHLDTLVRLESGSLSSDEDGEDVHEETDMGGGIGGIERDSSSSSMVAQLFPIPKYDTVVSATLSKGIRLQETIVRLGIREIACAVLDSIDSSAFIAERLSRTYDSLGSKGDHADRVPVRERDAWSPIRLDGKEFFTAAALGRHLATTTPLQGHRFLPQPVRTMVAIQQEMAAWTRGEVAGPVNKPAKFTPSVTSSISFHHQRLIIIADLCRRFCKPQDDGIVDSRSVESLLLFFGLNGYVARRVGRYERSNEHRGYGELRSFSDESQTGVQLTRSSLMRCVFEDGEWRSRKRRSSSSETVVSDPEASPDSPPPSRAALKRAYRAAKAFFAKELHLFDN